MSPPMEHPDSPQTQREADLQMEVHSLRELLRVAKCPNCDGSGAYLVPVCCGRGRQVSETEMVCCEDPEPDLVQCEWCDRRNAEFKDSDSSATPSASDARPPAGDPPAVG